MLGQIVRRCTSFGGGRGNAIIMDSARAWFFRDSPSPTGMRYINTLPQNSFDPPRGTTGVQQQLPQGSGEVSQWYLFQDYQGNSIVTADYEGAPFGQTYDTEGRVSTYYVTISSKVHSVKANAITDTVDTGSAIYLVTMNYGTTPAGRNYVRQGGDSGDKVVGGYMLNTAPVFVYGVRSPGAAMGGLIGPRYADLYQTLSNGTTLDGMRLYFSFIANGPTGAWSISIGDPSKPGTQRNVSNDQGIPGHRFLQLGRPITQTEAPNDSAWPF